MQVLQGGFEENHCNYHVDVAVHHCWGLVYALSVILNLEIYELFIVYV